MPGVVRTNLMRHANPEDMARAQASGLLDQLPWKTVKQGAATSILAAYRYLRESAAATSRTAAKPNLSARTNPHGGVADYALDLDNAAPVGDLDRGPGLLVG